MSAPYVAAIALLSLTVIPQACRGDAVRHFGSPLDRVKVPFQAETLFHAERQGPQSFSSFNSRTLVWYQSPERYRLELIDWPGPGLRNYLIRSGSRSFSTIVDLRRPHEPRWEVCPTFWLSKDWLEPEFQRDWHMRRPKLVAIERLQGIRVEHWRGRPNGRRSSQSTMDLWLSTDKRLPLVLKVRIKRPLSVVQWHVRNLRLGGPIPGYVFTPQVHPKGGFIAQLKLHYKPLWMILLWYALFLTATACAVLGLTVPKTGRRKALAVAFPALTALGLLSVVPSLDHYQNQLSCLPALLLIAAMFGGMFAYCYRRVGMPGDVKLFAGMRWPVIVWLALFLGLGFFVSGAAAHANILTHFDLNVRRFVFLPQTLATVVVYAAMWAALEEVFYRGYVTGLLSRRYRSGRLVNVLQAVVFTVPHIPARFSHYISHPTAAGFGLTGIFFFSIVFGGLRLKYHNLGASWLVHSAYNTGFFYAGCAATYGMLGAFTSKFGL